MRVQHIPALPDEDVACNMLMRIESEFSTIAVKRGWNITSLTEMCCCDDGIHYLVSNRRNSQRGKRTMPDSVWGYNLSSGRRHFSIHIRLRMPSTHHLLPYEEVARTMAHEMAHCAHGSHSADFYEMMEDIQRQHKDFLQKGVVLDQQGFPMGSDQVYTLGGGNCRSSMVKLKNQDNHRKKSSWLISGQVLGTANTNSSKRTNPSSCLENRNKRLREAARIAAEKRQLDESKCCLPCTEIIEILDDENVDKDPNDAGQKTDSLKTIDLTVDEDKVKKHRIFLRTRTTNNYEPNSSGELHKISSRPNSNSSYSSKKVKLVSWSCNQCTYINKNHDEGTILKQLPILVCDICNTPRVSVEENSRAIQSCS